LIPLFFPSVNLVERRHELRFVRNLVRDLRAFGLDPVEQEFALATPLLDVNLRLAALAIVPVNGAASNKFCLILRPNYCAINFRQRFPDGLRTSHRNIDIYN
jgi:hypothetical protein